MPYQKQDQSRYENFGGINTKISPYLNNQLEFLNLVNCDFQVPGAIQKRWGSTQLYAASYFQSKVLGLFQYSKIDGSSTVIVAGATTAFTSVAGFPGLTQFLNSVSHASMFGFAEYINFATFGVTTPPAVSNFQGNANYDFTVMNDQLYACNGKDFWRWNGSSFFFFGIPLMPGNGTGSGATTWGITTVGTGGSFVGFFRAGLAYVNDQAIVGNVSIGGAINTVYFANGATAFAVTFSEQLMRSMNPGYGLSNIAIYITPMQATQQDAFKAPLYYVATVGISCASGSNVTYMITNAGYSTAMQGLTSAVVGTIPYGRWYYSDNYALIVTGQSYQVVGGATISLDRVVSTNALAQESWYANTAMGNMIPSFIENHDGRLFYGGASYFLSTLFWGRSAPAPGENPIPELIDEDANLEVRTNDGDIMTGLKSYNGNLIITKNSTFHSLNTNAEDPTDWVLSQISSEYGCVSNRAICEYGDILLFLDRKGIIQFNGANLAILSTKVDPIFQRMNVSACKDNASLTYDKQRNQILCDIPVDGSTYANLTVVYDIVAKAWTTYSGYNPAITIRSQIPSSDSILFGGYSGMVSYFGSSFTTDNGVGFTVIAKTGFMADLGHANTKLYRRLFVDCVPYGASSFVTANFYQDYGSSILFSATFPQSPFQNRIEYGLAAKSMSVEFVMGSTWPFLLNGLDSYYRFLRPF